MQRVHELPGTTFSNPGQRGDYDAEKMSALTLAELERWLTIAVAGYHGSIHGTLKQTPAGRWEQGVAEFGPQPLAVHPAAFLIDFLPVIRRRITRTGIVIDHVHYFANALKPWIARRNSEDKFIIRRDPRDISRNWVLEPEGEVYIEVPYRNVSHPAVTLWEHKQASARLHQQGHDQVNEDALFRMVEQMRTITTTAQKATRRSRRDLQRRKHLHTTESAKTPVVPADEEPPQEGYTASAVPFDEVEPCIDDYPTPDLSHLLPWAQTIARLPAGERIQRIRADRWIGYPQAVKALTRLETLFDWPAKQRMPNPLLIGPTNNGKSMIIERFRRQHPSESMADRENIPVLCVQMPSEPSIPRFYTAVLAALGAPTGPRRRVPELEQLALTVSLVT